MEKPSIHYFNIIAPKIMKVDQRIIFGDKNIQNVCWKMSLFF